MTDNMVLLRCPVLQDYKSMRKKHGLPCSICVCVRETHWRAGGRRVGDQVGVVPTRPPLDPTGLQGPGRTGLKYLFDTLGDPPELPLFPRSAG